MYMYSLPLAHHKCSCVISVGMAILLYITPKTYVLDTLVGYASLAPLRSTIRSSSASSSLLNDE